MKLLGKHLKFTLFSTILALIGLAIFASLSVWQWHRADEKSVIQQLIEQRQSLSAVDLVADEAMDSMQYRKVKLLGRYDAENTILLDNIVMDGRVGYQVVSPFKLSSVDKIILVNRGWLPAGRTRAELPVFETPGAEITLTGSLNMPRSKPVLATNYEYPDVQGEGLWLYLDLAYFAEKRGMQIQPLIVRLDEDGSSGFSRQWPRFDAKVGMHIGYAIHWLVFALATLVFYLYFAVRNGKKK